MVSAECLLIWMHSRNFYRSEQKRTASLEDGDGHQRDEWMFLFQRLVVLSAN